MLVADKPHWSRFGMAVTADGQKLWLDDPDGTSWLLPAPPLPRSLGRVLRTATSDDCAPGTWSTAEMS
jgi:hypothetical protein